MSELHRLITQVAHDNKAKGFWGELDQDGKPKIERNFGEAIALMHSELSEALEAKRKNLKDDKLPKYDGHVVELADCVIRIFDYVGNTCGADLFIEALYTKLEFNRSRPHKHGKGF